MLLKNEAADLIIKFLRNELTDEETYALEEWKQRSARNMEVFQILTNEPSLVAELKLFDQADNEAGYNKLFNKTFEKSEPVAGKRIAVWYRVAAAAVIFTVLVGGYLLYKNQRPAELSAASELAVTNDVNAPATNRAMITLADGKTVYLDSALNGQLAIQGNVKLVKLANGQISYESNLTQAQGDMQYNTLHNPRGSKVIDMKLSDGSRVWLNAGSSISYPIAFVGNERKVTLEGEAYFEIAHNTAKPFKVRAGIQEVEVLGTHFNVNAYLDEDAIRTTLLEGSVRVNSTVGNQKSAVLKPGQQGQSVANDIKVLNVDLTQVMAWKNGWFEFQQMDLVAIMRQISRWYNLDIVYKGTPGNAKFGGRINKELPLSKVLGSLEENGNGLQFKLEGNKLIVQP